MACVSRFPSLRLFLCLSRSACSNAFYQATSFNADISKWNTASVTRIECVFYLPLSRSCDRTRTRF